MSNPQDQRLIDIDGDGKMTKGKERSRFYCATVKCRNCGHGGELKLPKGLAIDMYPCPACYCTRLQRLEKGNKNGNGRQTTPNPN